MTGRIGSGRGVKTSVPGLSGGEFGTNPHRVFAEIQNRENPDLGPGLVVVNAEGKSAREHPVKPEVHRVDPMKKTEAFQIGEQRVHEVVAKAKILGIVEGSGEVEIVCRVREDDDGLHGWGGFSRERSSEAERNLPCPAATLALRAARTS